MSERAVERTAKFAECSRTSPALPFLALPALPKTLNSPSIPTSLNAGASTPTVDGRLTEDEHNLGQPVGGIIPASVTFERDEHELLIATGRAGRHPSARARLCHPSSVRGLVRALLVAWAGLRAS